MQIIISVVCIALGLLLIFVPQVDVTVLSYIFCAALIVSGVVAIVAFFLTGAYKSLHNYQFAVGSLLLILGCCGLLRADELANRLDLYIGLIALTLSVVILQSTVQMKVLENKLWIAEIVLTVVSLIGSVIILADVRAILDHVTDFTYWALTVVGALSLVSLLLVSIGLKAENKKAKLKICH